MIIKVIHLDKSRQQRLRQIVYDQEQVIDQLGLSEEEVEQEFNQLSLKGQQLLRSSGLGRNLGKGTPVACRAATHPRRYFYGLGLAALVFLSFGSDLLERLFISKQPYQGSKGGEAAQQIVCVAEPWTFRQGVLPIEGVLYFSKSHEAIGLKVHCGQDVFIHIAEGTKLMPNLITDSDGVVTYSSGELFQYIPTKPQLEFELYISRERFQGRVDPNSEQPKPRFFTSDKVLWNDSTKIEIL